MRFSSFFFFGRLLKCRLNSFVLFCLPTGSLNQGTKARFVFAKVAAKLDSWTGNAEDISPTREEMYKLKIEMEKDFQRAGLTESL